MLGLGRRLRHLLPGVRAVGAAGACRTRCPGFPLRAVLRSLWRMRASPRVHRWRGDVARSARHVGAQRRRPARIGPASSSATVVGVAVYVGGARCCCERPRSTVAASAAARSSRAPESRALGSPPCSSSSSKWWKYLTAKLTGSFNERADPKVQLEQAIAEAQDQHRRLKEQAANVIANQKQSELRLNAKMTELEKLNANARQALIMADRRREGRRRRQGRRSTHGRRDDRQPADPGREGRREPEDDGARVDPGVRPGQGGGRSRTAALLQEKIAEKSKLLSQLDQAKMQEEMNSAMAQLNETRRRRRADAQRGPGQDPGPLRQGQGARRAATRRRSSRACSRSSRPPPTSRPRAASASCAPSSASAAPAPAPQPTSSDRVRPRRRRPSSTPPPP